MVSQSLQNKTFYIGSLVETNYLENDLIAPPNIEPLSLEDLSVYVDDGNIRLILRQNNKEAILLPLIAGGDNEPLDLFHVPRFRTITDNAEYRTKHQYIVTSRATWSLNCSNDLPSKQAGPFENFTWVQFQKKKYNFPRWIFAHPQTERKPVCIDTANPFLCEELVRLLRKEPYLIIKEMYPSPNEAWVIDQDGRRYLNELRLLYISK